MVRGGSPGKNRVGFGARGIVGSLAKGYSEILSRHTLRASFSHTAKKKQSSIISQNIREWTRTGVCVRGSSGNMMSWGRKQDPKRSSHESKSVGF